MISVITSTWSNEESFPIQNTNLYKSFKFFNPEKNFHHIHFNRGHFHQEESEFSIKYGTESDYLLYKITLLKQRVSEIDSKYIIFCDANDVFCLSNVDYLLDHFDLDNEVIIGHEKNRWPPPETSCEWPSFKNYSSYNIDNNIYLNSGMILSSLDNYIKLLDNLEKNILNQNLNFRNDQGVFVWHYTSQSDPKITLDEKNIFALNTFSRSPEEYSLDGNKLINKTDSTHSCFIHDNGWNHGSPKFSEYFNLPSLLTNNSPHYSHLKHLSTLDLLPQTHKDYLVKMRDNLNTEPKVIYDIGACVMDWARNAKLVWPNSEIILFEGISECEDLFKESPFKHHIGVLGDEDGKEVIFYKNVGQPHGSSCYRENPEQSSCAENFFGGEEHKFKEVICTLDTVCEHKNFPPPDLIKLDVQGCEVDILKGAKKALSSTKDLIVELQHAEYNKGAILADESIKFIESLGFELIESKFSSCSHADADYHFRKKEKSIHYPFLKNLSMQIVQPPEHKDYLFKIKNEYNFNPKVIYDIGACVLHWTNQAKDVWPNSEYILFEAMEESEDLFNDFKYKYHIGVLSDKDGKEVIFHKNVGNPGGNSYYMENPKYNAMAEHLFGGQENKFKRSTCTLDFIQSSKNFPLPELIKIDVQGSELDILLGAKNCLSSVEHLIVELQHNEYNIGAKLLHESIPKIEDLGFKLEKSAFSSSCPHDADYHFIKQN